MLKIRDGVDLKELEKYGLKYEVWDNSQWFIQDENFWLPDGLMIDELTKEICLNSGEYDFEEKRWTGKHTTILYDLIKADLVEKVDEE